MNINIPPDSEEWLFGDRGPGDHACLWSFRYPPPCEEGDPLVFRFGGRIVAMAEVYKILPPGEHDTWAHHGKRYLKGHKVVWLQSSFEDLRHNFTRVAEIEANQRRARRARKDERHLESLFCKGDA